MPAVQKLAFNNNLLLWYAKLNTMVDSEGMTQIELSAKERGYIYNGWSKRKVAVTSLLQ